MKLNGYLVKSTAVAALGGLLFGFDTAVIAGTTAGLTHQYHLSPAMLGVTVSGALWGTVIGAMFAGLPGDRYGRRDSLRLMAVLYLISALGCAFAWGWGALVAFRFIGGLGIGGSSVLGPMYIAEVSPPDWRGRLVMFFQFNIVFGILLAYFSNYVIGLQGFGDLSWRWMLGVAAIPAAIFFATLFGIPRSPRWLVKEGRLDEARQTLRLTGEEEVEAEIASINDSIRSAPRQEALFQRKYRFALFLAVSVAVFNQLTGINAILYYLNDIFARAGFNAVSGNLQAVAVGATNLVFTIIAMALIDRVGRKLLLLIGSVGMAAALAGVSVIFFTSRHDNLLIWCLIAYIAFFASSQGAVIWVYISEVFPNNVRAKGQSAGCASNWFTNALIAGIFPLMAAGSGAYPFVFFGAMMVVQFFVVLFIYPETKGLSLEMMEKKLGIV